MTAADAPVPAEQVVAELAPEGLELVDTASGRKLITIRHDQVTDFIADLVEAQGESLLSRVTHGRRGQ